MAKSVRKSGQNKQELKRSNRWRTILTFVTLAALVLVAFLTREQLGETLSNLGRVNTWVLLLMIPLIAINYHTYARLYQHLFGILGTKLAYKPMYKVAVELQFVNLVFPSAGVSGFSYFGLRMKQLGASAGQATLVQSMRFVLVFVSFQALLLIGLFLLAVNGRASNLTILVASSLGTLLVVGTLLITYVVGDRRRIDSFFTGLTRGINQLLKLLRPGSNPETINVASARKLFVEFHENYQVLRKNYTRLKPPLIYAFFAGFTEVARLYVVYIAFNEYINFGAIILAYAVANFAGLVSVLPGGIGIYEGLMTAVLATVGVPPSTSLPATVMFRVLSLVIQVPPGYYFYHKALHSSEKRLV